MTHSKNNAIQGLRFWAITLIIASHCGFLAQGGLGNNIFFAMSGFFVCQPFSMDDYEYSYFGVKGFLRYYVKRIVRIIPACWLCMFFATWGLAFFDFRDFQTDNSLLLNMFFIKSKNHLWFLQQEVVFYVVAPFLILLVGLFKKLACKITKNAIAVNTAVFIFLNLLALVAYKLLLNSSFTLYGNGNSIPFRLWLFIIGMSFAYMLRVFKEFAYQLSTGTAKTLSLLGSVYVIVCLALSIFSSEQIISRMNPELSGYFIGWEQPVLITYLSAIAIMVLCLLPQENIICRFLGNSIFTVIGNVSFSMYLLHFVLLQYFAELSTYRKFIVIYLLSLALSILIYNHVEQPLINKTKEYLK